MNGGGASPTSNGVKNPEREDVNYHHASGGDEGKNGAMDDHHHPVKDIVSTAENGEPATASDAIARD